MVITSSYIKVQIKNCRRLPLEEKQYYCSSKRGMSTRSQSPALDTKRAAAEANAFKLAESYTNNLQQTCTILECRDQKLTFARNDALIIFYADDINPLLGL